MSLLLISLLAGVLSVLAPCVISLLPVLVARSAEGNSIRKALLVVTGLAGSVFTFTLLLKASTAFIGIPQQTWQFISGTIIVLFGTTSLFPELWEKIAQFLRLQKLSSKTQQTANKQSGAFGDILLGASLGPVFSACSPTYALIVATVLPASFGKGIANLLAFTLGLSGAVLIVAFSGQKLIRKLGWSVNPKGWFKRTIGVVFILIGLLVIFSIDKDIQGYLVENGLFDWQVTLETKLQQ